MLRYLLAVSGDAVSAALAAVFIDAGSEAVWEALCQPEAMSGWLAERIEAPGGIARGAMVELFWDSIGVSQKVEVEALEAPVRMVFGATSGRRRQHQETRIRAVGDGTEVTVAHTGFADTEGGRDQRAGQQAGWHATLRLLKRYVERHAPATRQSAAVATTWVTAFSSVTGDMFTAPGLGRWLCPGGASLGTGEGKTARLGLASGQILDGIILAWAPPRELVIAGTIGSGPEVIVRLRAISEDGLDPGAKLILVQLSTFSGADLAPITDAVATGLARLP